MFIAFHDIQNIFFLGAWFSSERWIAAEPYANAAAPGQSDVSTLSLFFPIDGPALSLDGNLHLPFNDIYTEPELKPPSLLCTVKQLDIARGDNAKENLERHWDSWIQGDDWKWIVDHGFNTVRLPVSPSSVPARSSLPSSIMLHADSPLYLQTSTDTDMYRHLGSLPSPMQIGYYHLASLNPDILRGTAFEPYADTFSGAWSRIENAIEQAGAHGLGILIDLHGVAGSQNADAHCGESNGRIEFWDRKKNLASTALALRSLGRYLGNIPHCVGLELMNEPQNHKKLKHWYQQTIAAVQSVAGHEFPIYIGDAWDTGNYADFTGKQSGFVVLDHHLYRCFTDQDIHIPAQGHVHNLLNDFQSTLAGFSNACGKSIVVGEFSAALNPGSLSGDAGEQDAQRRAFVHAELELFERHCAGWFFWTLKKGEGWDAGWSAVNAMQAEILPANVSGRRPIRDAEEGEREHKLQEAFNSHVTYWDQQKGNFQHDRFQSGLEQGWQDARLFHERGWELGFLGPWAKARLAQHIAQRGGGEATWEFEHGLKQGIQIANDSLMA